MGHTKDDFIAQGGFKTGTSTGSITVASSEGQLYQQGTAITATATELNVIHGDTPVTLTGSQTITNKTISSGNKFSVEAGTTSAALTNYGVSTIGSTVSGINYTLTAPVAGILKMIYTVSGTCSANFIVQGATNAILFNSTNWFYFRGANQCATFIGVSTQAWQVVSTYGTCSTTS